MKTIKSLMRDSPPVITPSIYDGISALLVKKLGFEAAYIGSWATTATKYGIPDVGYISLADMVDQVHRMRDIVDVPLVVDGEGGWGNPLHVARSVRQLERSGANAIHIEDHDFGKHLGTSQVLPTGVAADKIKAAVDARVNDDFQIIARSDALGSEGLDAAVDRLLTYQESGADALFLVTRDLSSSACDRLLRESRVPLVALNDPRFTADEHSDRGVSMILYYGVTHVAAESGVRGALSALANERSTASFERDEDHPRFDRFLGIESRRDYATQFNLKF